MNKTARILFAFWLVLGCSIGSPQPCFADTPITIKGETEVRRTIVRLSDVFNGVPSEIDRDIAQAPQPGKEVTYDVTVLVRLAKKYQLDWEPESSADHVVIKTASTRITADVIRDAVVKRVKEGGLIGTQKDLDIDVSFDNHALQIDLPADHKGDFTLNNFDMDSINKHFHADLVAETNSGPFSLPLSGRILLKRNVPVLVRRLEAGTTIGALDLDIIPVPEEKVNGTVITEANQLVGHELRHDIDEGEILHTHDVMPPRLVTRGSLVTMKIETPFMEVTAQGKAMQDGTKDDVVRVLNTQSNRIIEGTVSGAGTVTIHTAQKIAAAQ